MIEITVFDKVSGVLSKKITLRADGTANSDGSECKMSAGEAKRTPIADLHELAKVIEWLKPYQAIALGTLREDLPDKIKIVSRKRLNGKSNKIARTKENITYREGKPAAVLLDLDRKGMPDNVRERLDDFWETLVTILPGLSGAAHLIRNSTSAGLYRTDTREWLEGSGGVHAYVIGNDGNDAERFLKTLHQRCWLAGFGWIMLARDGKMLERSIIDCSVYSSERLVFEGAPIVKKPLAQDPEQRRPVVYEGTNVDTRAVCPPLTADEQRTLDALVTQAKEKIKPEADKVRAAYIDERAPALAKRTGKTIEEAKRIIESQCGGVLLPEIELEFVNKKLKGCTVKDVLDDPERFDREVLADPIEGPSYGRTTAVVLLRRDNGRPWIKSFAHGGMSYSLVREAAEAEPTSRTEAPTGDVGTEGVSLTDFYAYMIQHNYIFAPSGDMWSASSINARLPQVVVGVDKDGDEVKIKASNWLDQNRPVEQITWAPGMEMIVRDFMISDGGWIPRKDVSCYNLYRPSNIELGNADEAGPWSDLVHKVFPNDAEHIIKWFAQRVQHPEVKINHGLVLGSQFHGIGKDTLLEPVKRAVGSWNFKEVSAKNMFEAFNPWLRAVILRVSEVKDMGDVTRFELYEGMKSYLAAPPDTLPCNEKNIKQHYVLNCMGVILTTNHLTDGIYLPAEDRRHFVAWSECKPEDFTKEYWTGIYKWYDAGGDGHVAAYLASLDISDFDPKAPPPKTPAFWSIVNANRTSEESELSDVLDALGSEDGSGNVVLRDAVTLEMISAKAPHRLDDWIREHKNRKAVNHRLEACGYRAVNNPAAKDGYWRINDRRQVVYAKISLPEGKQREAAEALQREAAEAEARKAAEAEADRVRREKAAADAEAQSKIWRERLKAADRKRAVEERKAANALKKVKPAPAMKRGKR
jgi:Family of unknown function (DUF5906)